MDTIYQFLQSFLKNYSYPFRWDNDSIIIDFRINQLRIKKVRNTYTIILSGREYPIVQTCQWPRIVIAVIEDMTLRYSAHDRIESLLREVRSWLPFEEIWADPERVEIKLAPYRYIIEHREGDYYFQDNQLSSKTTINSFSNLTEEFKSSVKRDITNSINDRYIMRDLLACEHICHQSENDNLTWLITTLINQTTDLLLENFIVS